MNKLEENQEIYETHVEHIITKKFRKVGKCLAKKSFTALCKLTIAAKMMKLHLAKELLFSFHIENMLNQSAQ